MVCKVCGQKAQVEMRSRGLALCREHYLDWFVKETERAIRRHRMLLPGERVLVAVSGGRTPGPLGRAKPPGLPGRGAPH